MKRVIYSCLIAVLGFMAIAFADEGGGDEREPTRRNIVEACAGGRK